jgi:formylglycine-generating enzyme required for sulfatase activity
MRRRASYGMACLLIGPALVGCSDADEPRAQIVVVVDTNAPLVGQLIDRPDLSSDAAIDALRVDEVGGGPTTDARPPLEVTVPDVRDWPVSFGVVLGPGESVLLRLWGFRSQLSVPTTIDDAEVSQPVSEASIVRLVALRGPEQGIEEAHVLLHGDCIGSTPDFGAEPHTCVDAERLSVPAHEGVEYRAVSERPASRAASWAWAGEQPCPEVSPDDERICIRGGFSRLGHPSAAAVDGMGAVAALPMQPVRLRSFYLDRSEMTVGRFRALAARVRGALPRSQTDDPECTWLGSGDSSHDDLPLNCITFETALEVCALEGGTLPSEARWEHAARGRGQGRIYPWGDDVAECCTASVNRSSEVAACGIGVEPAGAHTDVAACGSTDVSRDGVLDLGGGLSELTLDAPRPYDDVCWRHAGVPLDPVCSDATASVTVRRGGNWLSSFIGAMALARYISFPQSALGFRCAYAVTP